MAKKKKSESDRPDYSFLRKDENGFHRLTPIPGGAYDRYRKLFTGLKIPKDPDKFLYSLVDTYGTEKVVDMMRVNLGDYVYNKGINHALNINIGRSIPRIEDGLKSGERRALYTMAQMKLMNGHKVKVSAIVGRMIETVYPHGDRAPADIIYRLGRDKAIMIPYVSPGGNFGNMEDQKPAAPRYASAGLSEYAVDCFFREIGTRSPLYDEKDNYDFSGKEPIFLTSRYPNVLMQWNQGIGKGAASWLGAFNSKDVFKAAILMLDDPTAQVEMYPDLPVPTPIVNKKDLKNCFDKKEFKVKMQAPYEVIVDKRYDNGRVVDKYTLVFTSLPITVTGAMIKEQIQRLKEADEKSAKKQFAEVLDVLPIPTPKTPGGIELIVEYEKGYDPHALAEKLYRRTSLSKTIGVQYDLVMDNRTVSFTPRQIMNAWISQRYDQKRRYYHQLALQAAKDKAMYEALCTILSSKDATDKAIQIIRTSANDDESIERLCKEFKFTAFQAGMVIMIRLKTLSRMNVKDTEEKRDKAVADYKHYRNILTEPGSIKELIREELQEGLKKYGKNRIAPVITVSDADSDSDKQMKWIYYNETQYFCTTDPADIAKFGDKMDRSYQMIKLRNQDEVILIDRKGYIRQLNGYGFTVTDQPITMDRFGLGPIVRIMPMRDDHSHVALITKAGYGKLMEYHECNKTVKGRLITFPAGSTDELADIIPIDYKVDQDDLIGIICGDQLLYAHMQDMPILKRSSLGNYITKGVKNPKCERLVQLSASDAYFMMCCESGYVKVAETKYLTFKKSRISGIATSGKKINEIVGIPVDGAKMLFYHKGGCDKVQYQVTKEGKQLNVVVSDAPVKGYKLGSTISSPIKVMRFNKNEYYHHEVQKK